MPSTPDQREILSALKSGSVASSPIDVFDDGGKVVGRLVPLTWDSGSDLGLLEDLCRWRSSAKNGFLTVFEPSVEKTRSYLTGFSLPDPDRILYLIEDADGRRVGNIGLCNVTADAAELDNVVRGEVSPVRGFMRLAISSLLKFAFDRLGVSRVYLNVLSNNQSAVDSYLKAGFVTVGRTTLTRIDTADGYRLTPSETDADEPGTPSLVLMEIRPQAGALSASHPAFA